MRVRVSVVWYAYELARNAFSVYEYSRILVPVGIRVAPPSLSSFLLLPLALGFFFLSLSARNNKNLSALVVAGLSSDRLYANVPFIYGFSVAEIILN